MACSALPRVQRQNARQLQDVGDGSLGGNRPNSTNKLVCSPSRRISNRHLPRPWAWMPRTTPHPPVPQESGGHRMDTSTTLRRVSDKTPPPTLAPPLLRRKWLWLPRNEPIATMPIACLRREDLQMRLDEIGVPQRGPENLDATPMRRQLVRSPPHNGCFVCDYCCHLQLVAPKRFLASLIPHLGFPLVHSNSSLAPQSCFEK